MRYIRQTVCGVLAITALAASGCAPDMNIPRNAYTARVTINGEQLPTAYTVQCTQRDWFWTIETEPKEPGFTAIIETGAAISPKITRIRDLTGFTGSSADGASDTQATFEDATFRISGTAHGAFADRPTKPAEVQYRMEAHC